MAFATVQPGSPSCDLSENVEQHGDEKSSSHFKPRRLHIVFHPSEILVLKGRIRDHPKSSLEFQISSRGISVLFQQKAREVSPPPFGCGVHRIVGTPIVLRTVILPTCEIDSDIPGEFLFQPYDD